MCSCAGNVVLGASDGIEGIQQIGYALSSAGNKITNGNAITEFRRIRSGQKPASIAGIDAFNPVRYAVTKIGGTKEDYESLNMMTTMALPHAANYNSVVNAPRIVGGANFIQRTTYLNEDKTKVLIETPRGRGVVQVTPNGSISAYGVKDGHGVFYSESSKAMAQIENTIGKSIPLNSTPVVPETPKYPVTVYNPNAVALSTADYFNIPKLHDLLVSPSSSRLYSVVPEMHELDIKRETFKSFENGYVKNPTAQNITNYINNTNYLGTGGKKGSLNGLYMYVVDANNNIIIGNRAIGQVSGVEAGKGLPHPTLIGGFEPKVQGAGIVTIQGGKIIKVDNASGHFRPDSSSLGKVEELFLNKVPDKYYDRKFEGFIPYEKE